MSECVLITGARAPAALDLARTMKASGLQVHMADCIPARMARWSNAVQAVHRHASPVTHPALFARDMRHLLDSLNPVAVIPTCEEVFHLAACAQAQGWSHRLIAPGPQVLTQLHHKGQFADLCRTLDLPVPQTTTVTDAASLKSHVLEAQAVNTQVVIKPAWSRFGSRTLIAPSTAQLATIMPCDEEPWIVQTRVRGDEVSLYAVAHAGQVTAFSAYRTDWRTTGGAAYVFNPLQGPILNRLQAMAESLADFAGTGQLACDAIVDADDTPWLIECNPRSTSGVHLFARRPDLGQALLGRGQAQAVPGAYRNGLAFDSFGLADALRTGRFRDWRRTRKYAQDVVSSRDDIWPSAGAMTDMATFGFRSLTRRLTLSQSMTADIEWNGQPLMPESWERS